jgi:hypothetical protein
MAQHFNLVKTAQGALDDDAFDLKTDQYKLLGLQLLIKVGDISNVCRPFEMTDK